MGPAEQSGARRTGTHDLSKPEGKLMPWEQVKWRPKGRRRRPLGPGPSGGPHHRPWRTAQRSQDRLKQSCRAASGRAGSLLFLVSVGDGGPIVLLLCLHLPRHPDELVVVVSFVKPTRTGAAGLPSAAYPIEEVRLPKVTRQNIIEVGFRSA